jgi:hypothetical protein
MRDTGIPVANVVDPYPIRSEENVSTSLLLPAVTGTGKKRIGYPCRALTSAAWPCSCFCFHALFVSIRDVCNTVSIDKRI